ncbi:seryl-trna mitochondrial [Elysia marginata]|uniref:Seryl-trna mitochondrial n=1 Tax=Elysia marginata TaxID=1093978 RepID=A0AAV4GA64_9GAST|nr:seryl-trna mitochondrial [Elysia marginata]
MCKVKDTRRLLCDPKLRLTFSRLHSKSSQCATEGFVPKTCTQLTNSLKRQRFFSNHGSHNRVLHNKAIFAPYKVKTSQHQFRLRQHHKLLGSQPTASVHSGGVDVEDEQPPSWLFVSPAVAGAYGAQVNVELDLEERLSGDAQHNLRENIKWRGLSLDIDGLLRNLHTLKQMQEDKAALASQRDEILHQFKLLKQTSSAKDSEEIKKNLGAELRSVKAKIADLKSSWDMEEKVMLAALNLPNDLHPTTPLDESLVLRKTESFSVPEPAKPLNHVKIAKKFDLIKFRPYTSFWVFAANDLVSMLEWVSVHCCYYVSLKEGCGGDVRNGNTILTMLDPHKTVIEPMNHLSGVSLHMFAAYVAKTCIGDSVLPLQLFGCGRRYQNSGLPGLFGATQTTQASLFSCVKEEDVERQFESSQELVWEFLHKLRQLSAKDLSREEKRRVSFEMFSPSLRQFLPVASVSDVGDFVSRRLMVTHNQNHADIRTAKRLHMIHGTVLNLTSFLALWMEHSLTDNSKFTLCNLPPLQDHTDSVASS